MSGAGATLSVLCCEMSLTLLTGIVPPATAATANPCTIPVGWPFSGIGITVVQTAFQSILRTEKMDLKVNCHPDIPQVTLLSPLISYIARPLCV